jgi:DNA-binding response OmpR family regulator
MTKILIVEDDSMLHEALTEFLKAEKFEIFGAYDGDEAIKIAKKEMPDLILLDIILPKKDGFEVLDYLKLDKRTQEIPIVLLTNLESAENIQKAFEKGATTYLVKANYRLEDIVKKIKEILENK